MSDQRGDAILRNLVHDYLTDAESELFKHTLQQFRQTKSVTSLCQHLRPLINTKEKLIILVELSSHIPAPLRADFHRICSLQFKHYETYLRIYSNGNAISENPRVIAQDPSGKFKIVSKGSEKKFMVNYNNYKNSGDINSQHGTSVTSGVYSEHDDVSIKRMDDVDGQDLDNVFMYSTQNGPINASQTHFNNQDKHHLGIKRIFLARREDGSLGLGIHGGKEFGSEITISVVDPEGPAAAQGLLVGDQILEVNGTDFRYMTHAEAVTIMRNAWNIIMLVQKKSAANQNNNNIAKGNNSVPIHVKDLEIIVYPGLDGRLGCSTNRRNKNNILTVKDVDPNSSAEKSGILQGDCITKIDGVDVRSLSEKQITSLTKAKRLVISIKRVVGNDGYIQRANELHNQNIRNNSASERTPSPGQRRYQSVGLTKAHLNDHERFKMAFGPMEMEPKTDETDSAHQTQEDSNSSEKGNWVLTPKDSKNLKTFHKREFITAPVVENRSRANSHSNQFERRSRSHGRDPNGIQVVWGGGVRRYVRSRSQSPHILRQRPSRSSREDQDMMLAIQMGIEKRQRALRLSLYQSQNANDLDWEM